jgi:hypothetical protein
MFEALDISADSGLTLLVYPAQPGSTSADALSLACELGCYAGSDRRGVVHTPIRFAVGQWLLGPAAFPQSAVKRYSKGLPYILCPRQ